jgi:molybdopterin molybdotransferase
MIELEKALQIARNHVLSPGKEKVPLAASTGRYLAEDLKADRDMPPFHKASMDGFACRKEDLPGLLEVLELLPAGQVPSKRVGAGQCSRIMTGGQVPDGADCVIMQEHVVKESGDRIRFKGSYNESYICRKGEDLKKGALLLEEGTLLEAQHLGMLAAVGKSEVLVTRRIHAGILATGNELVDVAQIPVEAQIRNSNSHQLAAQVQRAGHTAELTGIVRDEKDLLAEKISGLLDRFDLLLITGGASVGEFDLVPGVLQDLGFSSEFDRVAMQPGKPLTFAQSKGKVCFGLSGNPVSCFVQFEMLVKPFLCWSAGGDVSQRQIRCRMENGFTRRKSDRLFFLPVVLRPGGKCAPLEYHGSAHLHALRELSGFAELAAGKSSLKRGEEVDVRLI